MLDRKSWIEKALFRLRKNAPFDLRSEIALFDPPIRPHKNRIGLRDVVAQGPSKSRRIKNVDGYFFHKAMLMLRGTARKNRGFP